MSLLVKRYQWSKNNNILMIVRVEQIKVLLMIINRN
jgi:hypothetical protein